MQCSEEPHIQKDLGVAGCPAQQVGGCCAQVVAEEKAAASAKEGLGKRAREAEASAQALAETVEELRLTLDRQRASAELRYTPLHLGSS